MQDVRCLPGSDVAAASLAVAGVPLVDLSQQAEVLASDQWSLTTGLLSKDFATGSLPTVKIAATSETLRSVLAPLVLGNESVCKACRRQTWHAMCELKRAHLLMQRCRTQDCKALKTTSAWQSATCCIDIGYFFFLQSPARMLGSNSCSRPDMTLCQAGDLGTCSRLAHCKEECSAPSDTHPRACSKQT